MSGAFRGLPDSAPMPPTRSILLLPGLACDQALFHHQAAPLAEGARLHISRAHAQEATLPAMATRLLAEHPGRHVLVGCSMGGMLAMELHRQAPDRIEAIALLGTTPRPDTPELLKLRSEACALFAAGRMDEVLRANVLFAFHPHGARRPGLVQDYLTMIRRAGPEQLIAQNRAVMARIDSRPHLRNMRCPVLVACGEADQLTPPDVSREMVALLTGSARAQLEIVPGAGHMLTMEQPERVTKLLLEWLAALTGFAPSPAGGRG
jgi:pimeloyl-ACP methyl ester carboxylesterase